MYSRLSGWNWTVVAATGEAAIGVTYVTRPHRCSGRDRARGDVVAGLPRRHFGCWVVYAEDIAGGNKDHFTTQRDITPDLVAELCAAGFHDADEIGRGGFGVVYRCTQVELDRTVAVKVLPTDVDEDRERFLREQRAMGRLTGHPNLVEVLQVGQTAGGQFYLVMPYHARGSLDARIRRDGPLPLEEVLRIGVKIAGALKAVHGRGILHRDVKPANVLFTDYGEPALTDFGIAHMPGAFETAAGTITGSPAFTAPEILAGEAPSEASDVYGLGATLFAALTGHAAFERRRGEKLVAQFLRIAEQPLPNLREQNIPDDVAGVIERAMSHEPRERPSTVALGEELQRIQLLHGLPVDQMALTGSEAERQASSVTPGKSPRQLGNLPLDLTSFVGRDADLAETGTLLAGSRLLTLTGPGGVGKTRLALRVAARAADDYPDGVWLVELGEVRDPSLLIDVLAAALGLQSLSPRPLNEVLIGFLSARKALLVLDNCEQLVDAVAKLAETMLRACPHLHVLVTSREILGIGAEQVFQLSPLSVPDPETESPVRNWRRYDAMTLFAERAAAVLPGFEVTDENNHTVARICARLDGLPLAIELAAAQLRAMSLDQILERLTDRYKLLTRGSRGAPTRQQTLLFSIEWSYDLCTRAEQQLWGRVSVFAGSFELEAAVDICRGDMSAEEVLDLLASLVDKSILIRSQSDHAVRFRMLDTVREYGRSRIVQAGEYSDLRRRHRDWYRRLAFEADADWFGPRELDWIDRLDRELPNLREALEFDLSEAGEVGLDFVVALSQFWIVRGPISEGRRWLDRALAGAHAPSPHRAKALYIATLLAELQNDQQAAEARVAEARELIEHIADPNAHALLAVADQIPMLTKGEIGRAQAHLDDAIHANVDPTTRVMSFIALGWIQEVRGDFLGAISWFEKALTLTETLGESVYKAYSQWSMGYATWRQGDGAGAAAMLKRGLELARVANDRRLAANFLEVLAWVAGGQGNSRAAVTLLAAAEALALSVGCSPIVFPNLTVHHEECERTAREALDPQEFDAACRDGAALSFDDAVAYALAH